MHNTKILKRHIGLPVKFDAFNGQQYNGQIRNVKNGIATVLYSLPDGREFTTYLDRNDQSRLTFRPFLPSKDGKTFYTISL